VATIAPDMRRNFLQLAVAAALLAPGGVDAQSASIAIQRPAPQFSCTFALSAGDCGFYYQAKAPGRATLVRPGREGGFAVRLRTHPGDNNVYGSGHAERTDRSLSQAATDCYEGREQ